MALFACNWSSRLEAGADFFVDMRLSREPPPAVRRLLVDADLLRLDSGTGRRCGLCSIFRRAATKSRFVSKLRRPSGLFEVALGVAMRLPEGCRCREPGVGGSAVKLLS